MLGPQWRVFRNRGSLMCEGKNKSPWHPGNGRYKHPVSGGTSILVTQPSGQLQVSQPREDLRFQNLIVFNNKSVRSSQNLSTVQAAGRSSSGAPCYCRWRFLSLRGPGPPPMFTWLLFLPDQWPIYDQILFERLIVKPPVHATLQSLLWPCRGLCGSPSPIKSAPHSASSPSCPRLLLLLSLQPLGQFGSNKGCGQARRGSACSIAARV